MKNDPLPPPADPAELAEIARLRDEMRALMDLIPGGVAPALLPRRERPDSLSDEDAVEAGFDNLPL